MIPKEELITTWESELKEKRKQYEALVGAIKSGRVTSQQQLAVIYERMIRLEEEMAALESRIDDLRREHLHTRSNEKGGVRRW